MIPYCPVAPRVVSRPLLASHCEWVAAAGLANVKICCQGPGSVGGPIRCPWYLFHRLF
ncbi:unnamed protein product [Staurois parvus]|uniref:Uncharacterized protein n=1 Tax=Staurois parvus TaxID=386267 RepID=A0ABN9FFM8_9NEOB|nr:unnamed protein product [Staurois parvus]